MTAMVTELETGVRSARQDPPRAEFEWLRLLGVLTKPTELVDRALAEALKIRERLKAGYPRKAAVLGANRLGLLAMLFLRLQGVEVVTVGHAHQPLFTARRLRNLPGWRHVRMSPALAHIQLIEETGARYASASELTLEGAPQSYGPFDMMVVASTEPLSVLRATKSLADEGVLVDLTCGDATMEIWTASPTPGFLVRHRVVLNGRIDLSLYRKAVRDLALADLEHPGWLARLLTCSM